MPRGHYKRKKKYNKKNGALQISAREMRDKVLVENIEGCRIRLVQAIKVAHDAGLEIECAVSAAAGDGQPTVAYRVIGVA